MDILGILSQLGINLTVFVHLILFIISFAILKALIFGPYAEAAEERERRTIGGEELATEIIRNTESLQKSFETKAKEVNAKISAYYDAREAEAKKDYDLIVTAAREKNSAIVDKSRKQIEDEIVKAKKELEPRIGEIAQLVTSQLIGRG